MPLLPGSRTLIALPIADKYGLPRQAIFRGLRHTQLNGSCEVHIDVEVVLCDAAGNVLRGGNFVALPLTFSALNDTLVDADDHGAILRTFGSWETEADKQAVIDSYPQNTMWQGDYFEYVRDNAPIVIKDLILLHMTQAAALGRYA